METSPAIFAALVQCIGLPNLDVGGFLGNKTDAFVAVVYEDACKSKSVKSFSSPA